MYFAINVGLFLFFIFCGANTQTFNCSQFGGPNVLLQQSSVCNCPAGSFVCGRNFGQSCVSLLTLQTICSNNDQVNAGTCAACSSDQAGFFRFTGTNGAQMCIDRAIACLCPSTQTTCPALRQTGTFALCSPTSAAYLRYCGTIADDCGDRAACGFPHVSPGCGSLLRGCQSCQLDIFFNNNYCFQGGVCNVNNSFYCTLATGRCLRFPQGECGACDPTLNFRTCPFGSVQRCVEPDEVCWRCTSGDDGVPCVTVNPNTQCDANSIDCGVSSNNLKLCMPLTSACGPSPTVCRYFCGTEFRDICTNDAIVTRLCNDDFGPWVEMLANKICPDDTFLCPGNFQRCLPRKAACSCLKTEQICDPMFNMKCVATSVVRDACSRITTPTTTPTTTTTRTIPLTTINESSAILAASTTLCVLLALSAATSIVLAMLANRSKGLTTSSPQSELSAQVNGQQSSSYVYVVR